MAYTPEQIEARRQRKAQREAEMHEIYRKEMEKYQADELAKKLEYEAFIRHLRENPTDMERRIKPRLEEMGFVFQFPISPYVVDFFHPVYRIAIEIDGASHFGRENEDAKRERNLLTAIPSILRFSDSIIRSDLEGCIVAVERGLEFMEMVNALDKREVKLAGVWKCARTTFQMTDIQAIRALQAMGIERKKANRGEN